MQIWPLLDMMPAWLHLTACSRSASSKTSKGDLPPVSRVMFLRLTAAIFIICRPVAVEPVKAILSTSRCDAMAAPASLP